MNIKQQYELLKQVFEQGKTLQFYTGKAWADVFHSGDLVWNLSEDKYRIKPEPREWWARTDQSLGGICEMYPFNDQHCPDPRYRWIRVREVLD